MSPGLERDELVYTTESWGERRKRKKERTTETDRDREYVGRRREEKVLRWWWSEGGWYPFQPFSLTLLPEENCGVP